MNTETSGENYLLGSGLERLEQNFEAIGDPEYQMPYEVEALSRDQFLTVKETLTRMGIPSSKDEQKTLLQSCHLLHKQGRYYICHFKHMFLLDGRTKVTRLNEDDYKRLQYVVALLEEWGLIKPLEEVTKEKTPLVIVPFAKKTDWILKSKYTMGVKPKYESKEIEVDGNK